jgi:bidirectional [NiFe] hydrogenase diaphorase subunit
MVTFSVNGRDIRAPLGSPLLKALLAEGFDVPNLCWHEALSPYGACRLCLVEVDEGRGGKVVTSCNHPVLEGLKIHLDTPEVIEQRRSVFEVLLAQAPSSAALARYAARYGVTGTTLRRQEGECILCGLCERVCKEIIGASAIGFSGRGARKELGTPFEAESAACIGCGSCARICPTGCIKIVDTGTVREMPAIHARHELIPCRVCGTPTITKAHAAWLVAKTKQAEADATTCDRCKAKGVAQVVLRTF